MSDPLTKDGALGHLTGSALRDIQAILHPEDATVQLSLPDRVGRLRRAGSLGERAELGRKRSQKRRAAFEAGRPILAPIGSPPNALALLPLVHQGETLGVVEIVAPERAISERWGDLSRAVSRAAKLIHQARQAPDEDGLEDFRAVSLVREMIRSSSAKAALQAALDYAYVRFQVPLAGWLVGPDPQRLTLVGVRGLGSRKRGEVRSRMGSLPRWETQSPYERHRRTRQFADILQIDDVTVLRAGDALLIGGDAGPSATRAFHVLGDLLEDVFDHLAIVDWAERRNTHLDLGLALTAHEMKGPLSGARAAIDHVLTTEAGPGAHRDLLSRSSRELDDLLGLVHPLLRWAVGIGPLRRRPVDVVKLVEEAEQSCRLETGQDRISIQAPGPVVVPADAKHLRGAIANVLRNALAYAPDGSEVTVRVEMMEEFVTVSVNDKGSGLAAGENESIFDPFVRGAAGGRTRAGRGLGLFIARRVVEAHEGRIWVDSNRGGTTFRMQLPRRKAAWGNEASAS